MKSSIPTSPRMKYVVSSLQKTVTVCPPFAGFVLGRECQVWALCSMQGAKDPLEMLCLLILTDASVQAPTWENFWPVVHKIHIPLKKAPFEVASYNLGCSLGANWFQWDMPDMMTWHTPRGRGCGIPLQAQLAKSHLVTAGHFLKLRGVSRSSTR